jgi:hypothetical protein
MCDELNALRAGEISLARARASSSLAARILESMRIDIEVQFLYLSTELKNLPALPDELNGEVQ